MKRTIYLLLVAVLTGFPALAQNFSLSTVVIDPGHGGTDAGAVSRDGKHYEKTFTLDIASRLADKIRAEYPEVNVIMTRDKDVFIPLNDRAEIANKAGADLFISVHINSTTSATPNGYSVHVLGKSSNKNRDLFAYNMDVCKRENSVILLEDDYSTTYQGFDPSDPESFIFLQLMQNSNLEQSLGFAEIVADKFKSGPIKVNRGVWQDPFLVLWRTAMPAVLIECGFISNASDLEILKTAGGRDKIATQIFLAFKQYKASYDDSLVLDVETTPASRDNSAGSGSGKTESKTGSKTESKTDSAANVSGVRYGVQIFAGSKRIDPKDKAFMGYTPYINSSGKLIKYVIGVEDTLSGAKAHLPEIRKKYPDAFLVKIEGDSLSMVK